MRRHLATYRVTRTYRRLEPFDGRDEAATGAAALAALPPRPWPRGWTLEHVGEPRIAEVSQFGVAAERDVTWTSTAHLWESDLRKALRLAERDVAMFEFDLAPDWMAPDGWNGRGIRTEIVSIEREEVNVRLRRGFSIRWRDLLSTDECYWPRDAEIDQAFEAFRHLVRTARGYGRQLTWHRPTTNALLSGRRGNWHGFRGDGVDPVTSVMDLRERFQAALLGTGHDFYDDWRRDHGYALDATLDVEALHRGKWWRDMPDAGRERLFRKRPEEMLRDMLVSSQGMRLTPQLNSAHRGADTILGLGVAVDDAGFRFILAYGYEGSVWDECIARTRGGEPFADTLDRAYRLFRTELVPDFEAQVEQRRRKAAESRSLASA